jgi:hypothetical protein
MNDLHWAPALAWAAALLIAICAAMVVWPRRRDLFVSNADLNAHRVTVAVPLGKARLMADLRRQAAEEFADEDPTPYCSQCGTKKNCTCPPHPEND